MKERILQLPDGELTEKDVLIPDFLLEGNPAKVAIYYAPFDYINTEAKVTIIGLTPGLTQMKLAFQSARSALSAGKSFDDANRASIESARFAGSMRKNLIKMLNQIELNRHLGLEDASELFAETSYLLDSTSLIRYPVIVKGKNYTGHNPHILRLPSLNAFFDSLGQRLSESRTIVIPMGNVVSEQLKLIFEKYGLDKSRCLFGFPHASGANNGNIKQVMALRVDEFRRRIALFYS